MLICLDAATSTFNTLNPSPKMGRKSRSSSPDEFPLLKELGLKATSIIGDGKSTRTSSLGGLVLQSYLQMVRRANKYFSAR